MSALISFLGGSAFRMLFGEISSYFNKRQDHEHEVEMIRLQSEMDDKRHKQAIEMQKELASLGIKTIEAQAEAVESAKELDAYITRVKGVEAKTGIRWLDAWRGMIQPMLASVAIFLWVLALTEQGFKMTDWDREIVGAILGVYLANRHLTARGK